MKKLKDKLLSNTIIKFLLVGGGSTGIDFVIYMLLSLKISIMGAKAAAMVVASIFSYVANKHYTFENAQKTNIVYLMKFYLTFGANFVANIGVNYWIYSRTGYKVFAYVIATMCGMTVNYIGQRFFVFSSTKETEIERK